MIKRSFKIFMLGLLVSSATSNLKADPVVIGLGGAASGWGLAQVWEITGAQRVPMWGRLIVTGALSVCAYGIRTTLIPSTNRQHDALGLLAGIVTFFTTIKYQQGQGA